MTTGNPVSLGGEVTRRFITGLLLGLIVAVLEVILMTLGPIATPDGIVRNDSGGAMRLLVAGASLGAVYALLFRPTPGSHPENVMGGVVIGVVTWVVFALSLFPILNADAPMWHVDTAASTVPELIAYVLHGSLTGFLYGLVCERLRLVPAARPSSEPATKTNVVIVGGGYAGVSAAESLDKAFANDPGVDVWLVSKINYLVHTPLLSEVSSSAVNPQHISPPLRTFFRRVHVVQGEVASVDWARGRVDLSPDVRSPHRSLAFDHLLITTGCVPSFFGNREIEANTLTFKSLQDSIRLRNQIIDRFERADFEQEPENKRQQLTFVVVGGGFAGVELIGGINDFGRGMLPYYPNIAPDDVRFVLVHPGDVILPELSESLGRFAQEKMATRGVEFFPNKRVTGAKPGMIIIGDERLAADTVVWTAGNQPNPIVHGLGVELTRRGQIPVSSDLRSVENPALWAAGDCAQIPIPNDAGSFYPPTAQHAFREGKLLGHNVVAAIRGKPLQPFDFKTLGSLAALGHQLAVAEVLGYRFSGFLAWIMWRAIYLSKLPNLEKRLRVLLDWVLDVFFPPDIVQTMSFDAESERDVQS